MPTYPYVCENCSHEWEQDQLMREEPAKECPKCGEEKAKRLIGKPSFILKGGGWSSDGYGK